MSTPPKRSATLAKAASTDAASVTSQATAKAAPPIAFAAAAAFSASTSSSATSAPAAAKAFAVAAPIAPPCPGDRRDLAGERQLLGAAELRLLERPVLAVEHVGFGDRLEAPNGLGIGDGRNGGLGEIGGDRRILARAAEPEQAEPRHQHDAGQRIEHRLGAAAAGVVAREVVAVVRDEGRHCRARRTGEIRGLALLRRRHDERPVLGADGVVGRHHAGRRIARDLGAVDEVEDRVTGAEIENEPTERAFRLVVGQAAGAAHDRRHRGERHRRLRQLRGREHRAPAAPQRGLRERNHLDHALIGFARALAEREDAVLVQDEADRAGRGGEHPRRLLGEAEAGHDVRHDAHAAVVKLGGALGAVGLVDQAQHRGGVGMIDKALRDEGVQQRLDRRIGRHRVEQVRALRLHHLLIRHGVALEQQTQLGEPHRRQPGGLDHRHVGARALDAEDIDLAPHQVRHAQLHRGVAAAVQHELRVAAEQARRVDPQREIPRHAARGVTRDQRLGLGLHEAALHACSPMTATGMPAFAGGGKGHLSKPSALSLDLLDHDGQ